MNQSECGYIDKQPRVPRRIGGLRSVMLAMAALSVPPPREYLIDVRDDDAKPIHPPSDIEKQLFAPYPPTPQVRPMVMRATKSNNRIETPEEKAARKSAAREEHRRRSEQGKMK